MKKYLRKIHQWSGLVYGLLVFMIAITGVLYAFQEEIQNLTQPYRFIEKQEKEVLLPSVLGKIAKEHLPNKELHSIKYYTDNQSVRAIFYHDAPSYYYIMYMNPYTGEVLHTQNMEEGFFRFILKGHFYLWFPPTIGQPIVAIATLVFFLILITGIILWFPKTKNAWKSKTWFQWKSTTQWKRKNFDLHAILGFYSFFVALIFVVTGLVWGFNWFAFSYYKVLGGKKSLIYQEPLSEKKEVQNENVLDILYQKVLSENPTINSIEVHEAHDETSTIAISTNTEVGTYWKTDYQYFDQYSLQEKESNMIYSRFQNATLADKMMRMNYDIHTGAIFGLAGKIFMCLMSLLIASLPITGILFWYGKHQKEKYIKKG